MSSQYPLIFDTKAASKGDSKTKVEEFELTTLDVHDLDENGRLKIPHIFTQTNIKWQLDLRHVVKESEKKYFKELKTLDLSKAYPTAKDFQEIAIFVKKYCPSLEMICLGHFSNFEYLVSLLDSTSTVKEVEINKYDNLGYSKSISALGEILKTNKTLEKITFIKPCTIHGSELGPLKEALDHNTLISFENLDLRPIVPSSQLELFITGAYFNEDRIDPHAQCNENIYGIRRALARNLELRTKKDAEKVAEARSTSAASAAAKP